MIIPTWKNQQQYNLMFQARIWWWNFFFFDAEIFVLFIQTYRLCTDLIIKILHTLHREQQCGRHPLGQLLAFGHGHPCVAASCTVPGMVCANSSIRQKVSRSLLRLFIKHTAALVLVFLFLSLFVLSLALRKPAAMFVQPYDPLIQWRKVQVRWGTETSHVSLEQIFQPH